MVNYQLRSSEEFGEEVASADLPDKFAAHNWALDWVRCNAAHSSYILETTDRRFSMAVFRTDHGQWYGMPAPVGAKGGG